MGYGICPKCGEEGELEGSIKMEVTLQRTRQWEHWSHAGTNQGEVCDHEWWEKFVYVGKGEPPGDDETDVHGIEVRE